MTGDSVGTPDKAWAFFKDIGGDFAMNMLDEGAGGMTSQAIAEEQERLGATISASGSADRSTVVLSALSANLGSSLDLLATMVAIVTPEGECEFANSSFENVLGLFLRRFAWAVEVVGGGVVEPGRIRGSRAVGHRRREVGQRGRVRG